MYVYHSLHILMVFGKTFHRDVSPRWQQHVVRCLLSRLTRCCRLGLSHDLYNQSKNARDDSDRYIIELDFIIPLSFGNMTSLRSLRNCLHLLFKRAFLCCKPVSPCNTQLGVLMSMSCHPKQSCSPFKPLALLKRRHSWFKRCKCVSTRHDDAVEILGEIRGCSIPWFLFANIFYILLFWLVKQHICIIWYTEVIWNPMCVGLWMALSADSFSVCFQFVKCV